MILLRGDATETGCVTDCRLRSDSDLRQHTQQYRPAPRQKGKQTRPVSVSSPLNNITLIRIIEFHLEKADGSKICQKFHSQE